MIQPLGYQRGFVARDNPVFKGDVSDDLWQLPTDSDRTQGTGVKATDPLCSPQQSTVNYTSEFPMLVTAPGDYLALRHQENGHVSLPTTQQNKPRNRGTIYIYGTDQPKMNDTLLSIHGVWNVNGTGGDGRGRLLATRNFDDGQCYQVNSGTISASRQKQFAKTAENPQGQDLWCQSDIQLPTDITTGANYTLYWVWDWPTLNKANAMVGEEGVKVTSPEIYTSCIDVQVVEPCSEDLGDVKSPACSSSTKTKVNMVNSFKKSQSYGSASVPQELTGNFAVGVDDAAADSGSNDGMSAPPNLATGGAAAATGGGIGVGTATASTLQTVTTPAGAGPSETQTVTVPSTVTVTQVSSVAPCHETIVFITNWHQGVTTVTVTAQSTVATGVVGEDNGHLIVGPATPGVAPSVDPFMNRRRSRIEIFT